MIDHSIFSNEKRVARFRAPKRLQLRRLFAAEAWIGAAIAAELKPRLVQRSLQNDDAGEWFIVTDSVPNADLGPLPAELWEEAFFILEARGDIYPDKVLKSWHGTVLLDNCGPRAIELRLRLARRSLNLADEDFYQDELMWASIERDCQTYQPRLSHLSGARLAALSARYDLPEEWLISGTPVEIEITS
jgi:hypothetical protein